jgi:hypothetical protein
VDEELAAHGPGPSTDQFIQAFRQAIVGPPKSWVLFSHGTCVILRDPDGDLAEQATGLLRVWGPGGAGTPAGDFLVVSLRNYPGYMVGGHHPDIVVYVSPEDLPEIGTVLATTDEVRIGQLGLARRHKDAQELRVVHVEDRLASGWTDHTAI